MEACWLVDRQAGKQVITEPAPQRAAYANRAARKLATDQVSGTRAVYPPIVGREVELVAACEYVPGDIVTPEQAFFPGQHLFAVKAAHRVTSGNGHALLGRQRVRAPLPAQAGVNPPGLPTQGKGLIDPQVPEHDPRASAAFMTRLFRGGKGVERAGPAPPADICVQSGGPKVAALVKPQLPAGGAPLLLFDIDVVYGVSRVPAVAAQVERDFVRLVAVQQPGERQLSVVAFTAVAQHFVGVGDILVVGVVVVIGGNTPVAQREKVVQGVRAVAKRPVLEQIFTHVGLKEVVLRKGSIKG